MSVGRDVSLTSRRSDDFEYNDSVSSEDPVSRSSALLIRRPPPRNRKMFVMCGARLLYKPSPHCSWYRSIHQSVLLIHLLHTTRNNMAHFRYLVMFEFVDDKLFARTSPLNLTKPQSGELTAQFYQCIDRLISRNPGK